MPTVGYGDNIASGAAGGIFSGLAGRVARSTDGGLLGRLGYNPSALDDLTNFTKTLQNTINTGQTYGVTDPNQGPGPGMPGSSQVGPGTGTGFNGGATPGTATGTLSPETEKALLDAMNGGSSNPNGGLSGGSGPGGSYTDKDFSGVYAKGGPVKGPTGGMDDERPMPRLSDGEYIMRADIVSALGDGNTEAGFDWLNNFVNKVEQHKYGQGGQPPPMRQMRGIA